MRSAIFCSVALYLVTFLAGCPAANTPPVADAGSNQTVTLGDTVTLDGSGSADADGEALSYQWLFTSRPESSQASLSGAGTAQPTFVPDVPGTYQLSLTVFDVLSTSSPSTVTITVSGTLVQVPDLAGLTEAEAGAALEAAELSLGEVTMESSASVPAGQVISQSPAAGSETAPGTSVEVAVSTGPSTAAVPDLLGRSLEDATDELESLGLVLGTVTQSPSDTIATGEIISQSIAPGTAVDEGTAVGLEVSSGAPIDVQLSRSYDLRELLNDPGAGNVLRPYAVAPDPVAGQFFVTALLTSHVGMYNLASGNVDGSLDSGFDAPGPKFPFVSPDGSALYVVDGASGSVARIDIESNTVTATADLGTGFIDLAVSAGTVYVARDTSPGLLFLDATTLEETGSTSALDGRLGDMHLDPASGVLRILNAMPTGDSGEVFEFDTNSQTVATTVPFTAQEPAPFTGLRLNYDAAGDRFFVLSTRGLAVYNEDGTSPRFLPEPNGFDLVDMVYVPGKVTNQRLVALGLAQPPENSVQSLGARIFAYNPNLGQITSPLESVDLGEANLSIALDASGSRVLSPDNATGTLWDSQAAPFSATPATVPLGVNIDQLIVSGEGLFGASRFAGNLLFRLAIGEDSLSTFSAGRWPAPMRRTEPEGSGPQLTVLNAWDRSLTTFSATQSPQAANEFTTNFPPATTERLPDLAVDPGGTLMAIAYPEFGQVGIFTANGNAIGTIEVPDAAPGAGARDKGELQVLLHPGSNALLYVFDRDRAALHRYDGDDNYAFLGTTDLSTNLANMADAPPADWLVYDEHNERLYLGPVRIDAESGEPLEGRLPAGQVIRGIDVVQDVYWTVTQADGASGLSVTVQTVTRTDNQAGQATLILSGTHAIAPEFAFDTANRRFFVGYPATGVIEEYSY